MTHPAQPVPAGGAGAPPGAADAAAQSHGSLLFPELASRVGPPPEPGSRAAVATPAAPAARVRPGTIAGPATLARFGAALGLSGKLRSLQVGADGELTCQASTDGETTLHFALVPPERRAWLRAEGFAVVHTRAAGPPPDEFVEGVRAFVRRYGHVPLLELARRVQPEGGDDLALPWDDATTLFYSYGAGKAWRTFTEGNELYRNACEEIHGPGVVAVKHEEHECSFNKVFGDRGAVSFFNTSEVSLTRPERVPSEEGLITDIEDLDVIRGGDRKLSAVLESVADLPRRPELVVIHSSCVPVVTGDDLEAAADKARARVGVPFVVLGQENNPQDVLLRKLVSDPAVRGHGVAPHRVHLLGFPDLPGRRELVDWLAQVGVELGVMLFPDLDPALLQGFGEAGVHVAYDWDRYAAPIAGLADHLPHARLVRPPPPFGLDDAAAWLLAVAQAAGREEPARARLAQELATRQPRWDQLRAAARQYRLGFVSDRPDWPSVFAAGRTMGVPILDVVDKLGFAGVDVLAFAATGAPAAPTRPTMRVVGFDDAASLRAALAASPAVAFYSELYFDRRLSRLGKNTFSLRDFDCGLGGAERTLRRLLVRCQTPFYRLYGHLLGEPFGVGEAP